MKTKLILALLALTCLCTVGCKTEPFIGNEVPPPQYALALELIDQAGNNISEVAAVNTTGTIVYSQSGEQLWNPSFYSRLCEDNVFYLITHGQGDYSDIDNWPISLTWKIKSETIFGDKEIHLIESIWEGYRNGKSSQCASFEFDGKTYTPALKNGYWTARVVINR